MSLAIVSNLTAIGANAVATFGATGGAAPYTFSVQAGGAGGTIGASSGLYRAPSVLDVDVPTRTRETVIVTATGGAQAQYTFTVTDTLGLVCDIIQRELGLANGRVYQYQQKIMQPKDAGLYVAVGVVTCRPFGNTTPTSAVTGGMDAVQSVNMNALLSLDCISRDLSALRRKEDVLMSLNSVYAQQQMQANSFYIGRLPPGSEFVNLSELDGAAIPYRFNISVSVQYFVRKTRAVPYFDDFAAASIVTEP